MLGNNLDLYTISDRATAEDALHKFEENNHGTLFVIDDEGRVLGSVTDGDIRKLLIRKHLLITSLSSVMNTCFKSIAEGDLEKARKLFRQNFYLRVIPELDEHGKIIGVIPRELV